MLWGGGCVQECVRDCQCNVMQIDSLWNLRLSIKVPSFPPCLVPCISWLLEEARRYMSVKGASTVSCTIMFSEPDLPLEEVAF